jgi:hypothetical protein
VSASTSMIDADYGCDELFSKIKSQSIEDQGYEPSFLFPLDMNGDTSVLKRVYIRLMGDQRCNHFVDSHYRTCIVACASS